MRSQNVSSWKLVVGAMLFVVVMFIAGVFLISMDTSTNSNGSSVSTQIFPKQDCCVPSKDLKGSWIFANNNGSTFTADISDKAIKIYMNASNGTSMLYWHGTFDSYKPEGSVVNSEVFDDAIVLSKSTSKTFVVGAKTLSFDFTAMGATRKVDLSRV